jgi:hypothetical protein
MLRKYSTLSQTVAGHLRNAKTGTENVIQKFVVSLPLNFKCKGIMDKTIEYPIEDIMEDAVFIVRKFAQQFGLSQRDAFNYLYGFQGLAFLQKHYGYEHTQPAYRTIEAMIEICRKNGGTL